jgi:RND superfamily putative drug exporter
MDRLTSASRPPPLRRLASFCYRRRRAVVGAWVVLLAALVGLSSAAGGEFDNAFDLPGSESQDAADLLEDGGFDGRAGSTIHAVVEADRGVDDPEVRERFEAFLAAVRLEVPDVEVVSPYERGGERQVADGGRIAYAELNLADRPTSELGEAGDTLEEFAASAQVPGVRIELGGDPEVVGAEAEMGGEAIGLLAAVVILLIAFGSVLAMGLPIVTALCGIGAGTAIVALTANVLTMPTFTQQLVLMLGIGVGIDYALFIVTRYRQALQGGRDPQAAVVIAITTAGRAVLFAGGTVVISVLGLFVTGLAFSRALAIAAAIGVLMTMLASITLLPAVLGFVGRTIDRFGLPHRGRDADPRRAFWYRWSRIVQRRPVPGLVIGVVVLVVLAAPMFAIRLGFADNGNRDTDDTTRQAYDLLAEGFGPGFNGPLVLAAALPDGADDGVLDRLAAEVDATEGVDGVTPATVNEAGDVAVMQVFPTTSPQDEATSDLVYRMRDDVVPGVVGDSGVTVHIGGATAAAVDFADYQMERLPWFIAAVLLLSFLLLMITFRSLFVPLKAVAMNLLSIGAAYGVVVAVFQWGWLGDLIGAGEPGPVESWAPMMLFAIVFGLSMDYEVFLLSRIKEEYDRTGDNAEAVADGLAATARVITAAAAIMFCVFAGFVLSVDRAIQLFGLGLAVAVLVDATIVRMVLVPATTELLGDRNWWFPRWLDRIVPRIQVEAHGEDVDRELEELVATMKADEPGPRA